MAIEILEDPFESYPELKKERDKLKRLADFEEHGIRGRGGYRPNAGAPKKNQKTLVFKILINKTDEESVTKELTYVKEKYGH